MFFKKENKIEFFSLIPEVADLIPIIPASKYKPEWYKNMIYEFSEVRKSENYGHQKEAHTAKCPGIQNLINYGWIMRTWQDLIIETNGDGYTFVWRTPINQKNLENGDILGEEIGFHNANEFSNYFGGFVDSLQTVIKIQTPWKCIIPEDFYLYEGPIPYSFNEVFTIIPGMFSDNDGIASLNPQLKWNKINGKVLIKAGTPLAHYMLVPKKQFESISRSATEEQKQSLKLCNFELSRRFLTNYNQSKDVFKKIFKKYK